MYAPVPKKTRAEVRWQNKMFRSTECVRDLDKQIKMIIVESLSPTFQASVIFWGSSGSKKIVLNLKLNHHNQV